MTITPDRDCLNYQGDRTDYDENHLVGPDMGDGWLKPVEAEYDSASDTTLIRFESLRKQLWPPQAVLLSMQNIQKRQVLELAMAQKGNRKAINAICWGGNDGPRREANTPKVVDTQEQTDRAMGNNARRNKRVPRNPLGRKRRTGKH